MTRLHRSALCYAKMGWPVFPLKPQGKEPITSNGVLDATTSRKKINCWWSEQSAANVGFACGILIAIDLDVRPDKNGLESWRDLDIDDGGALVNMTPTGGRHLIFRKPQGVIIHNSTGKLGLGIDVKGQGGYIILPPSIHPNGQPYVWELSAHPTEQKAGFIPDKLLSLLAEKAHKIAPEAPPQIPDGERNSTLASIAGTMRRRGLTPAEILPSLLAVNLGRCKPPLPEKEIIYICNGMSRYEPETRQMPPVKRNGGNRNHWTEQYQDRWRRMRNDNIQNQTK